jgi:8-oxo-dGTP diphosphatase
VSFGGAKLAILVGDAVVAIERDETPGIDWPGHWDLPGGGREGDEAPLACALRETREELGVEIDPAAVLWSRAYPREGRGDSWFFVVRDDGFDAARVRFGDEGRGWALMPLSRFLTGPRVVPSLAARLAEFLGTTPRGTG